MIRFSQYRWRAAVSALALGFLSVGLVATNAPPAAAQVQVGFRVSFGYFEDQLSPYGAWYHDARWGDVWRPRHARSFRPYYEGYWEYTDDYGWMWISDEPWANVTYHYGRWVYDPEDGWLWIPGYVWAPAWVIWREGDGYLGWFPMPPDYGDFDDGPYYGGRYGWDDYYGYRSWYRMDRDQFFGLWIFVDHQHFYRHDYRRYVVERHATLDIIRRTSDSTRYAMNGNRIVNRSVPIDRLERVMHRRIEAAPAHRFLHANVPITGPSEGRDIARREHGGEHRGRDNDGGFRDRPHGQDGDRDNRDHGNQPSEQKRDRRDDAGPPPDNHDRSGDRSRSDRGPPDAGPFGEERQDRSGHEDKGPPPDHEQKSQGRSDAGGPPRFSERDRAPRDQSHRNEGSRQGGGQGKPDHQEGGHDRDGSGGKEHGHKPHDDQKDR